MISVCIPSFGRSDMVMETINPLIGDSRIDEIILCDDQTPSDEFKRILDNTKGIQKVKVVRNVVNLHNGQNKKNAISFSRNDWCLCLDNDNVVDKGFIDKVFSIEYWNPKTIYHPDFAAPHFNYGRYSGMTFTIKNISKYCEGGFVTLLNTNNYLVNRDEYLKVYQYNSSIRGADGIFFMYNWMKVGNSLYIVPGLKYFHRVHEGSEFGREPNNYNLVFNWLAKMKELQ